jgi:hypothetical protein
MTKTDRAQSDPLCYTKREMVDSGCDSKDPQRPLKTQTVTHAAQENRDSD